MTPCASRATRNVEYLQDVCPASQALRGSSKTASVEDLSCPLFKSCLTMTKPASDAISMWDISSPESASYSPLDGDATTDVAIVGGGYTGCSTALHLAGHNISSIILEAEDVGFGGSGRNAGLLNAGLWLPPDQVLDVLGKQAGSHLVDLLGAGPQYVFSLIEKYQIRCEATRNGTIHAAHAPSGMADLTNRYNQWQKLGAPVELLNRKQAEEKIGSSAFHGGLLDRRAGTINPMGYARGLARAAVSAGARLHTGTRVTKLDRVDGKWRVTTPTGIVTANYVVLGTNAYTDELWPGLNQAFTPIHYFQFASEPLTGDDDRILHERQGLWDTGTVMFSARRDAHGRLIVGSMGKLMGGETGLSRRWAGKAVKHYFPELGPVQWEKAWHGRIAFTRDHVPRVHKLAENLYTAIAYNGRGISPGTVFGASIADAIAGKDDAKLAMPLSDLSPEAFRALREAGYELSFKAWRLLKSI
jgi:glycine/D-amino acid oxidase-like deaminating enzyme